MGILFLITVFEYRKKIGGTSHQSQGPTTVTTMIEKGPYILCWSATPERHFIIFKNGVAIIMTTYEKEAVKLFAKLTENV